MKLSIVLLLMMLLFTVPNTAQATPVVIYRGDPNVGAYNQAIHEGVEAFRNSTHKECIEIQAVSEEVDYIAKIKESVANGYSPIVLPYNSPRVLDAIQKYESHREVRFVLLDCVKDIDLPNVRIFQFSNYEGSFMAGALAALMTKTNVVGFIYTNNDYPILRQFQAGFKHGVHSVNSSVQILESTLGNYPGMWYDVAKAQNIAAQQIKKGADVLFAVAGFAGTGVLAQAAESGIYAIGMDKNQNHLHPGSMIGSMVKRLNKIIPIALQMPLSGLKQCKVKRIGLAQDIVGLEFDGVQEGLVPQKIKERLRYIKCDIILGKIKKPKKID
ncbi:MAG: hypothetical protein CSA35_00255 [Dethiosulfovibrio peptidovorans]|nr:MAG: hypothetical protein CSA35_00255 [Dethiosulfovibrio peptidovorans]